MGKISQYKNLAVLKTLSVLLEKYNIENKVQKCNANI